ncbi:uncharacterized protein FIBRA_03391 [Fibroporia radiculosa]|uniref:Uncharacterized protein n=1 Tax=Fibroporia radiculosa TaxID=599839 RepID=J4I9K9_9APHY|nr:uncharacterized protein FIBRA_03391 [Fibroporia radiculosa]CCM01341.1 predicted protein [Fibroporia radiculosa]
MTTLQFSWADGLRAALSSCLYCFPSSDRDDHPHEPLPRARPDELEGLLADSDSGDAETLSLHSNLGDERRRKKRKRTPKGIRVFGYDLFGRQPIHLPESDDEGGGHSRSGTRARTISSSSTLDSDAAPLDASALDEASVARLAAATAAAEEEQRKAKEERRRLRRERKELKRMALAMAMGLQPGQEQGFEGFPVSTRHAVPQAICSSTTPQGSGQHASHGHHASIGSISTTSSPFSEDFGTFTQGQPLILEDDAEADGADFGGESYAHHTPHGASSGGSDSRSRTSGSNSNADPSQYNHHYLSQHQPPPISPLPTNPEAPRQKKRRSTLIKSVSSKQYETLSATSQSTSLSSPPANQTEFAPHEESAFEGFPGGTLDLALSHAHAQEAKVPEDGFPSVGLRGVQRTKSDMGVFLARRGDE